MTKLRVLISDKMSSQAAETLRDRGIEAVQVAKLSEEELCDMIGDFDGLAVRSSTKVTPKLLEHATRLKAVGRAGIGVDNIDVQSCTERGIVVMNAPFGNAITTAEHTLAMMFALARHIPQANESTHAGRWEKARFMGAELNGKLLGIIGAGNIGSIVAGKALGIGLRVQAFDPFLTEERANSLGIRKVTLDELLESSDIVSLHVPRTPETENIIDATAINKMKRGAMLINCARGGLVDEIALHAALTSNHLHGAAVDVYVKEPAKENPLFGLPNVVCTPHLGASTQEAQEKVAVQIAEQLANYLLEGAITNALNAPSLSAEEALHLTPYLDFCRNLGSLAGQLTDEAITDITIAFAGDVTKLNTDPLATRIIESILAPKMCNVNSVNAQQVAKSLGIKVTTAVSDSEDEYHNRITLTITTNEHTRSVSGTLLHNRGRIVNIKGVKLESEFGKHMLYLTNEDKPGVIGAIGTFAADHKINIAHMHLGRHGNGGGAIALLEVDDAVPPEQLEGFRNLDYIQKASYLHFAAS